MGSDSRGDRAVEGHGVADADSADVADTHHGHIVVYAGLVGDNPVLAVFGHNRGIVPAILARFPSFLLVYSAVSSQRYPQNLSLRI